jgi:hypothetical protein
MSFTASSAINALIWLVVLIVVIVVIIWLVRAVLLVAPIELPALQVILPTYSSNL